MAAPASTPEATGPGVTRRLVLLGGGEHARVVADAAGTGGWLLAGYTDHARTGGLPGLPYLGTDDGLADVLPGMVGPVVLVLGFGGPTAARRRAVERLGGSASWATVIHPAAWVSSSAVVGEGAVILAGAIVNTGAVIGPHAIVNSGAIVEHDVRVGAFAHVAPGVVIGGGAEIGEDAFLGLGAVIRDHVTVGRGALVAMGAVVAADVAADARVMGVPARGQAGDGG